MSSSQLILDTDILSLLMHKNSSVLAKAADYLAQHGQFTISINFCSMKITQDVREYAATNGVSDADALKVGIEEKSREFVEQGSELYGAIANQ